MNYWLKFRFFLNLRKKLSLKVLFLLGSGSGLSKNAGSGSVLNQSGSTTLPYRKVPYCTDLSASQWPHKLFLLLFGAVTWIDYRGTFLQTNVKIDPPYSLFKGTVSQETKKKRTEKIWKYKTIFFPRPVSGSPIWFMRVWEYKKGSRRHLIKS
jgi:hypothetical protein